MTTADAYTGRVLGASVASGRIPEREAMRQAVRAAMRSGLLPGTEILADSAFAGVRSIKFLESLGPEPVVTMPANHCHGGGSRARRRLFREQFLGPDARPGESPCDVPAGERGARQKRWRRRFGERWAVERVFAATRRGFGSGIRSRTPAGIAREVALKLAIHNTLCVT